MDMEGKMVYYPFEERMVPLRFAVKLLSAKEGWGALRTELRVEA